MMFTMFFILAQTQVFLNGPTGLEKQEYDLNYGKLGTKLIQWEPLGPFHSIDIPGHPLSPMSGQIHCIAVDPEDPSHLLVGAGGVWESQDLGVTWKASKMDPCDVSVMTICFNQENPQIVWAVAYEGLFVSNDGGKSFVYSMTEVVGSPELNLEEKLFDPEWEHSIFGSDNNLSLYQDADDPQHLVLKKMRTSFQNRYYKKYPRVDRNSLLHSWDQGKTWESYLTSGDLADLIHYDGVFLIASSTDSRIQFRKSENLIHSSPYSPSAIELDRENDELLDLVLLRSKGVHEVIFVLAHIDFHGTPENGFVLYRSVDGGEFHKVYAFEDADFFHLSGNPVDPDQLAVVVDRFALSSNGGETFNFPDQPLDTQSENLETITCLAYDPTGLNFWLGTKSGLWLYQHDSGPQGGLFSRRNRGIGNFRVTKNGFSPDGHFIATIWDRLNLLYKPGQNLPWEFFFWKDDPGLFHFDPIEPSIIYVTEKQTPSEPLTISRSTDGGRNFHKIVVDPESEVWSDMSVAKVIPHPNESSAGIFVVNRNLYRSLDQGNSFDMLLDLDACGDDDCFIGLNAKTMRGDATLYLSNSFIGPSKTHNPFASTPDWHNRQTVRLFDFVPGNPLMGYSHSTRSISGVTHDTVNIYDESVTNTSSIPYAVLPSEYSRSRAALDPLHPERVFLVGSGIHATDQMESMFYPIAAGDLMKKAVSNLSVAPDGSQLFVFTRHGSLWKAKLFDSFWVPLADFYQKPTAGAAEIIDTKVTGLFVNYYDVPVTIPCFGYNQYGELVWEQTFEVGADFSSIQFEIDQSISMFEYRAPREMPITLLKHNEDMLSCVQSVDVQSENRLLVPHLALNRERFFTGFCVKTIGADDLRWFDSLKLSGTFLPTDAEMVSSFEWSHMDTQPQHSDGFGHFSNVNGNGTFLGNQSFGTWDGALQSSILPLKANQSKELLFPHIAANLDLFWTGVVILNASEQPTNLDLRFKDAEGQTIQQSFEYLESSSKFVLLFDKNNVLGKDEGKKLPLPLGTQYVEVTGDVPLSGLEIFGSVGDTGDYMEGLVADWQPWSTGVIPLIEDLETNWQGIVLLNNGTQSAFGELVLMDREGQELAKSDIILTAGEKRTALVEDLFGSAVSEVHGGSVLVRLEEGRKIIGFSLIGDLGSPRRKMGSMKFFPTP